MLERTDRNNIESPFVHGFIAMADVDSTVPAPKDMYFIRTSFTRSRESLLSDNNGSHSKWKTCEHYQCSQVPDSGSNVVTCYVDYQTGGYPFRSAKIDNPWVFCPTTFGNAGAPVSGLPAFFIERSDGGFVPPPDDLDILLDHAISAMMPRIKAELSVVNSFIELKDFLSLRSSIESVKNTIGSLFKKGFSRKTLAETFRTKADVYLQYKFNIAPLLSDISGIYRALANTEKRMNALIARSGRVRVSHYTRHLTESGDNDSAIVSDGWDNTAHPKGLGGSYTVYTDTKLSRSTVTEPATFHVQVQYNYNYTAYQVEHARLLSLLDALGVNLNPAIIWNAIPWSFVVDWVFGIGQYLSTLRSANMDPKINILRCLWSIHRERRITVAGSMTSQTHYASSVKTPPASLVLPVVVEEAYRRTPFMPSSSSIVSSGLTLTEFSLGAALVVSRRRRPRRLRG